MGDTIEDSFYAMFSLKFMFYNSVFVRSLFILTLSGDIIEDSFYTIFSLRFKFYSGVFVWVSSS